MFLNFRLPVPSLEEQRSIAEFLNHSVNEIDAVIAEAEASIEEYKAWKASIIYEAVIKGLDPNAEMKDSGVEWMGQIPKAWKIIKLKQTAKINCGEYISKEKYSGIGKYDVIGANGKIGSIDETNNTKPLLVTGRVGTIGTVHKVCNAWITDNVLSIDFFDHLSMDYAFYVIPNFNFKIMISGTAMPLITATKLGNQYMPFPPVRDQEEIVTYLDEKCSRIDAIIEEKISLICDLEAYKKSLIFEVVTGKRKVV